MNYLNSYVGYTILLIFAIFCIGKAFWGIRDKSNIGTDFLSAKNSIPFGIVVASLVANWTWSATILGGGEGAYSFGVSGIWIFGIDVILSAIIFSPLIVKIIKMVPSITTFPEFIRLRIGKKSHMIFTIVSMAQMLCFTLVQILATGIVFKTMFGIPHWQGAIIGGMIITAFVAIGGLRAAIDTSSIFSYAILIALFILVIGSFKGGGGFTQIFEGIKNSDVPEAAFLFSKEAIIGYWLIDFFTYINYALINQNVWEHVLAVKPGNERKLTVTAAFIWFFIPAGAAVIGLVGLSMNLDVPGSDIILAVIMQTMPVWASYILAAVLIASIFSTASTCLNAFTNLLVTDLYKQYFPKAKFISDADMMQKKIRIIIITSGILISIFAIMQFSILWFNYAVGALAVPLLWPFVLSAFKENLNRKSVEMGLYAGIVTSVFFAFLPTLEVYTLPFDLWIGFALIHVVTIVVPLIGTAIKPDNEFRFSSLKEIE